MERKIGPIRNPPSRITPLQALSIWQSAHFRRDLDPETKKRFLDDERLARILKYPRFSVERALKKNPKLDDVLHALQSSTSKKAPGPSQKRALANDRLKAPTPSEEKLWEMLRNRQMDGYLFEREQRVLGWYVDFLCLAEKLVVEVDGSSHRSKSQQDRERDSIMRANGYKVIRFSNYEIQHQMTVSLEMIRNGLSPAPSKKARRQAKTAQTTPKNSAPSKGKKRPASPPLTQTPVYSKSTSRATQPPINQTGITKGKVRCAGCEITYVGTYKSDSGLVKCRKCGNTPIALCQECGIEIFSDHEGTFRCKSCDPSIRAVAREAAGRGAQHPTNNLRSARRGKRVR